MAKYRVKKWGMMKRKLRPKQYKAPKYIPPGHPLYRWYKSSPPQDAMKDKKFVMTKKTKQKLPGKGPKRWGPKSIKRAKFIDHYQGGLTYNW